MEREATWYDKVYKTSKRYDCYYKDSMYYPVWKRAIEFLDYKESVLEFGCGNGQFAHMLEELVNTNMNYIGIDFSAVALKQAKERVPAWKDKFLKRDLRELYPFIDKWTIVCLETLEHIEDDLGLLDKITPGSKVIASVPDTPGRSHVRHFKNTKEVTERYGDIIDIKSIKPIEIKGKRTSTIFLIIGEKK